MSHDLRLFFSYTYKGLLEQQREWGQRVALHDDVIKWKQFPRYWPFVRGIHRSSDAEIWCFLWSAPWMNGWVNNRESGDLRRQCAHTDVIVMLAKYDLKKIDHSWLTTNDPLLMMDFLEPILLTRIKLIPAAPLKFGDLSIISPHTL